VDIWKRFRKWGGVPAGITQNVSDFQASPEIENIFKNTAFVLMFNQSRDDQEILMDKFKITEQQMGYVTNADPGSGLVKFGDVVLPFKDNFPTDTTLYRLMTSRLSDLFPDGEKGTISSTFPKDGEI
jgi:hypothetical protein